MKTSFAAGSLVLAGAEREVALVWKEGQGGEARTVPAGEYRLRTTRVERSQDGDHWFVSQAGPPGETRLLEAGATSTFEVDATVHFRGQVKRKGNHLQLGFAIRGADGRGMSVYRNGKRVAVTYRVLDADGGVLAEGRMNYG